MSPAATTHPRGAAAWARDLAMGARFAVDGGREGWVRTLLTAVGVGLGVTLLLGAASVPHLMESRQERREARLIDLNTEKGTRPGAGTLLYRYSDTEFRGVGVHGTLLRPDGRSPVRPPGVHTLPRAGEMVVSPALGELLATPGGALLYERLGRTVVGTIAAPGLAGPGELTYYAGDDSLTASGEVHRISHFGGALTTAPMNPTLGVIVVVACVVLLMPVVVLIATAVRFGGEHRDRRMAALRLVGADRRMTRRMAAGETLCGALGGLLLGAGLFLLARRFIGRITLWDVNAFPSDLAPHPALVALIVLAVPLSAVLVTLVALRGVAIEPLGVVRQHTPRRRRVWWRLPLPVLGAVVLLLNGRAGPPPADARLHPELLAGGALLVLFGITVLLPWLVEAVVARLRGGPVPWQLAIRRLQLSSGTAARSVSGITVAVAGAIALQMLFAAVQDDFVRVAGQDGTPDRLTVTLPARDAATGRQTAEAFRATKGVRGVTAVLSPSALPVPDLAGPLAMATLTLDPRVPDAAEYARNTAARLDPAADVIGPHRAEQDSQFTSVRTGLLVASTVTMALIAASMLVSTLEQLRERRRLLAVLVAFGTRRADLGWSVLWQTAVPVALGLGLAVVGGCGLGLTLLHLVGKSSPDWSVIWPMTGAGAALVLVVTLLSLPPLWRLMRPDGLRTE
ncbi:ABC transporter permease [Streptomyces sp. MCA2]|uniref:ABC transporter permease n=1 Tax=Streptomyces sp. MCA2 TaxID=2944805 RepID=UPI00201FE6B8|nr:FtsX-like permease family protein [Streptomyces sp. MCA2]MCL7497372.1 ABC transporter permease [Streptomyces sp. MCA2]